jgi:hypothetical protein
LPGEVDGVEPGERVRQPARPDLEARLAQDAPEGDDVPDERVAQ